MQRRTIAQVACLLPGMLLAAVVSLPGVARAADPFLDAIQQEVHAVELDTRNQKSITGRPVPGEAPRSAATTAAPAEPVTADMPADMTREEFDAYLRQRYFGSYAFYRKLGRRRQNQIYRAYSKRPDIRFVREQIKQIYLNP